MMWLEWVWFVLNTEGGSHRSLWGGWGCECCLRRRRAPIYTPRSSSGSLGSCGNAYALSVLRTHFARCRFTHPSPAWVDRFLPAGLRVGWGLHRFDLTNGWPVNWLNWLIDQSNDQSTLTLLEIIIFSLRQNFFMKSSFIKVNLNSTAMQIKYTKWTIEENNPYK